MNPPSHGILGKFVRLLMAQGLRDGLHTGLMVYLARESPSSFGEFVLAFSLAQFILFLGEFGLNQPMVLSLSRKYGNKGEVLLQYSLIKAGLLGLGLLGVLVFAWTQSYSDSLFWMTLGICAGCGLEPLAGSFFVACRVRGRQDAEALIRGCGALCGYGFALAALFFGWPVWCFGLFKVVENAVNLTAGAWFTMGWNEMTSFTLGRRGLERAWRTGQGGVVFVFMALAAIGYNKANVFFLQRQGGSVAVASYGVAWEMVDGVSNMVATLLLSGIIYPLLVKLWRTSQEDFALLARQTAKSLTAAALPLMAALMMETDRLLPLIYGEHYRADAWVAAWLAPSVLIAFLHNLAAYMMLAFGRERLLLLIYACGLGMSVLLCAWLIPGMPLLGAALCIVLTKAEVAVCTVGYCQRRVGLMAWPSVLLAVLAAGISAATWWGVGRVAPREAAEALALLPLLALLWRWRPRKG